MIRGSFSSISVTCGMPRALAGVIAMLAGLLNSSSVSAQEFQITAIAEKKIPLLPPGPLFWRIENFPTLTQAQTAAGSTSLAAEAAGKAWLFTLGAKGRTSPGGTEVAEVGPVPPFSAPEYLLRINSAEGPPGAKTPMHFHPGSESFYVLAGELRQKTPEGESRVDAGQVMAGHGPGMPMQVSSSGTTDLKALVMFVADATKPFSSPTTMAAFTQDAPPATEQSKAVENLVNKAAALIDKDGKAAFAEFRKKDSPWFHGDTYLFAYDMKANVLLNPAFPQREGTNVTGQKDAKGKLLHQAIIDTAETKGSGWVDYWFPKPGQTEPSHKWTYVKRVAIDGVPGLIASGFFPD
jgi:quercetin dioxygenase-like cupin family protein